MKNKYKIKICKGCDHLNIVPLPKAAIACCPDSNYVDVEFCTTNERKFLDRIREFKLDEDGDLRKLQEPAHLEYYNLIFKSDFPDVNLSRTSGAIKGTNTLGQGWNKMVLTQLYCTKACLFHPCSLAPIP
jgi:hypothetical protein